MTFHLFMVISFYYSMIRLSNALVVRCYPLHFRVLHLVVSITIGIHVINRHKTAIMRNVTAIWVIIAEGPFAVTIQLPLCLTAQRLRRFARMVECRGLCSLWLHNPRHSTWEAPEVAGRPEELPFAAQWREPLQGRIIDCYNEVTKRSIYFYGRYNC